MFRGAYRDALARADAVLSALSEGVTVQDDGLTILYANDAAARLCGFTSGAEMAGAERDEVRARFELLDEHGAPFELDRLPGRRVFAGEVPEPTLMRVRHLATGNTWWSLVRASAVRDDDGKPVLVINIWHDVTREQRQRERERHLAAVSARLAESLEYATTLQSVARALVPDFGDWCGVEIIERDGAPETYAVAHVDPAKLELAQEIRRKYPPDRSAKTGAANVLRTGVPELYPDLPEELLRRSVRSEEHWQDIQRLGLFKSALVVPIMVGGRPQGTMTLIAGESGRRYDEADLELAMEIGRRAGQAIENARAYRAAQDAIRARDTFLAVAGHELRTPLAALLLQTESMRAAAEGGALARAPERFAPRLDKMLAHAQRISKLVDGLLDVTRIAEGRLELAPASVDLAALVRDVCERYRDDAARAGCAIEVGASDPCVGTWDAARLEQVVSNLLVNAMKYGAGKPIHVRCEDRGDEAVLAVRDEGIGIAKEDQGRIFERFERAVSERNYGGLGLGLWITRELVVAHGGSIEVESEHGHGATFTVRLPRGARA